MNSFRRFAFVIPLALCATSFASVSQAQDNGYTPPPMFGELSPPMVRPQTESGYIVEPKASPNTHLPPEAPNAKPVIMPRVSPAPDMNRPTQPVVKPSVPVPPRKMQPLIEAPKAATSAAPVANPVVTAPKSAPPTPPKKPVAAPAHIEPPAATPVPKAPVNTVAPVKRDPRESAIKGPVTMPALPTQAVQAQETFEQAGDDADGMTILERSQKAVEAPPAPSKVEAASKPVAVPKKNVAPASFDKGEQGVLKRVVPYAQGQIGLSSTEIDPIAAAVTQELGRDDKKAWRVQIRSYATPYGTGISSDRRIALSRALSLRTALIEQGVSAARIDVLPEGMPSTSGASPDRIDLYLYGPVAP